MYCILAYFETKSNASIVAHWLLREIKAYCAEPRSRNEIAEHVGIETPSYVVQRYIRPLLDMGLLEMTIPDKPKSKNQKYVAV